MAKCGLIMLLLFMFIEIGSMDIKQKKEDERRLFIDKNQSKVDQAIRYACLHGNYVTDDLVVRASSGYRAFAIINNGSINFVSSFKRTDE